MLNKKKNKKELNNFSAKQMENLREMEERTKKLSRRFWAGIFAIFIIAGSGIFYISIFYYNEMAKADLNSGYSKSTGEQLTAADWNSLKNDFVNKSGDTVTGNLTVNGDVCLNSGTCLSDLAPYVCPSVADFSTTVPSIHGGYRIFDLTTNPTTAVSFGLCLTDGCVIKREITNSSGVINRVFVDFERDPNNTNINQWTSSYNPAINTNGSGNDRIVAPYKKLSTGGYAMELRDDATGEQTATSWAVKDNSASYGINVYICAYQ